MDGASIRTKRAAAGLSGLVVCRKAEIGRNRLSEIERGQLVAEPEELARIATAIETLTVAQGEIRRVAAAAGWPGAVPVHA